VSAPHETTWGKKAGVGIASAGNGRKIKKATMPTKSEPVKEGGTK
jgi:hypothetical protein